MFQKRTYSRREIFDKINLFEQDLSTIKDTEKDICTALSGLRSMINTLRSENELLCESIDLLTKMNAGTLGESSNCELFMVKSYRNNPIIIKDGKLMSTDAMKSAYVRWDQGEKVSVEVES